MSKEKIITFNFKEEEIHKLLLDSKLEEIKNEWDLQDGDAVSLKTTAYTSTVIDGELVGVYFQVELEEEENERQT